MHILCSWLLFHCSDTWNSWSYWRKCGYLRASLAIALVLLFVNSVSLISMPCFCFLHLSALFRKTKVKQCSSKCLDSIIWLAYYFTEFQSHSIFRQILNRNDIAVTPTQIQFTFNVLYTCNNPALYFVFWHSWTYLC